MIFKFNLSIFLTVFETAFEPFLSNHVEKNRWGTVINSDSKNKMSFNEWIKIAMSKEV